MRALLPLLLLSAVASPLAHATSAPADAPVRMPGLWLMNTMPASEAGKVSSFHICVGKVAQDDVLGHPGSTLSNCRDQRWSKDAFYTYYQAVCDGSGSTATVEGKFAGDFKYNFQGEITTTFSPPVGGVAMARSEIDGRRLAPCPGGLPENKFLIQGQDGIGNLNLGAPAR
ncbi:MAG: DUF3617 domain-containing protein [Thauera sp.]